MKTVKVVAAVIKALNKEGEPIIFATQWSPKPSVWVQFLLPVLVKWRMW